MKSRYGNSRWREYWSEFSIPDARQRRGRNAIFSLDFRARISAFSSYLRSDLMARVPLHRYSSIFILATITSMPAHTRYCCENKYTQIRIDVV